MELRISSDGTIKAIELGDLKFSELVEPAPLSPWRRVWAHL